MESKEDIQAQFDELWKKYDKMDFDGIEEQDRKIEKNLIELLNKGAELKREHDNTLNGFIESEGCEQLVFYLNHFKWEDEYVHELFDRYCWMYSYLPAILRSDKCEFYLRQCMRDPDIDLRLAKNLQKIINNIGYKQKYEDLLKKVQDLGNST